MPKNELPQVVKDLIAKRKATAKAFDETKNPDLEIDLRDIDAQLEIERKKLEDSKN